MKAHKKPQDNTMKKLLITVRNFFLKISLIKYSWLEIQKMINKLIQQGDCSKAFAVLFLSRFSMKNVGFGRIARKIVVRAKHDEDELCKQVSNHYFNDDFHDHCNNLNEALNYGYVCLLLKEWEKGFKTLSKFESEFSNDQQKILFLEILYGLILDYVNKERFGEAIKLKMLISSIETENIGKYLWKMNRDFVNQFHSMGSDKGPNPLMNHMNFKDFIEEDFEKKCKRIDIFEQLMPLDHLDNYRNINSIKRKKPTDRPLNILVVSDNFNFVEQPCSVFKSFGYKLRYIPFKTLDSSLKLQPDIYEMIYGNATKEEVFNELEKKLPWVLDLINWCDVVFVEWWNRPAIFFSRYLDESKSLIVRLHSYEAFTTLPNFTNMNGVDAGIFISEHIREIFYATCIGAKKCSHRHSVVQNIRDLCKVVYSKRSSLQKKTLCLVGYSKINKDPNFALDILQILLNNNAEWRLKLIGYPWPIVVKSEDFDYYHEFKSKLSKLSRSVELIEFQEEIQQSLVECGFILSTSLREGSHEALVEGMSSGCIPVLRNWPHVSNFNGAKKMFPIVSPIDTPAEAAKQILEASKDFDDKSKIYYQNARKFYDRKTSGKELVGIIEDLYN